MLSIVNTLSYTVNFIIYFHLKWLKNDRKVEVERFYNKTRGLLTLTEIALANGFN